MRITGFGSSSALATGATIPGTGTLAGGVGGNNYRYKETALRTFTVKDVIDEFSRLSNVLARKIVSEEQVLSSLLALVQAGIIVLSNGLDDNIPTDHVDMRTIVDFLPAEHEFTAAFKRGYLAEGMGMGMGMGTGTGRSSSSSSSSTINSSDTQNKRSEPILRVSNRVRRAVLNPQEHVLIEGLGSIA